MNSGNFEGFKVALNDFKITLGILRVLRKFQGFQGALRDFQRFLWI